MKVSKQRAKARSVFTRGPWGKQLRYRTDDGILHATKPDGVASVHVAVIRGRQFTRPQAAKQRDV